jgi:predicted transcriptional regulator
VNGLIRKFFDNSAAQFASFFTTETNLSAKELEELKTIVEQQLEKKQ